MKGLEKQLKISELFEDSDLSDSMDFEGDPKNTDYRDITEQYLLGALRLYSMAGNYAIMALMSKYRELKQYKGYLKGLTKNNYLKMNA